MLIGTRSVGASEEISAVLAARRIDRALLTAKQDDGEAEVIARAGQAARVTVATNMAGRGTDIRPGPGVADRGGPHVILTEYHESRRIDRRLFGRCARQGDRGSCEAIVSMGDEVYTVFAPRAAKLVRGLMARHVWVPGFVFAVLRLIAQSAAERRGVEARARSLKMDRQLDKVLAYSRRRE